MIGPIEVIMSILIILAVGLYLSVRKLVKIEEEIRACDNRIHELDIEVVKLLIPGGYKEPPPGKFKVYETDNRVYVIKDTNQWISLDDEDWNDGVNVDEIAEK